MKFLYVAYLLLLFMPPLQAASMSSATCSVVEYHKMKNELNIVPSNQYSVLNPYIAEMFVSNHIYSIDKERDVGEEFQFGKNHIAKLLKYTDDTNSGFEAGLYLIDNARYIIAFGGTKSREKYSSHGDNLSALADGLADAQLLSNQVANNQVRLAATFLQGMQVDYPDKDITATGHSLGGGLAQFAGLMSKQYSQYKKIKAITFNTAPMPLTKITKKWVENLDDSLKWADKNNINFMANNDPLTNILISIENYAKDEKATVYPYVLVTDNQDTPTGQGSTLPSVKLYNSPRLEDLKIDTGIPKLNIFLNENKIGVKLKVGFFNKAQSYLAEDILKLTKLIYGKRIVLNTSTGHGILALIQKTSPSYASIYNIFRHGFSDVKVTSLGLYCNLFTLMENHVISYPKAERQYKFEPNKNASIYEVSIFLVNAFYYEQYRNALRANPSLTKYTYFLSYFNISWGSDKFDPYRFKFLKTKFERIYSDRFRAIDISMNDDALDRCIQKAMDNVFWNQEKIEDKFTRGQLVFWMVKSMKLNYRKIIKEVEGEIKEEQELKTGPGSLRYDPPLKSSYFGSGVYQFGQ